MTLPVEFLCGADGDLQGAFNRFEDYRDGFGVEFMTAVDAYLARIAVFPKSAYGIFYEPHPTRILVIAILDLRQDPEEIRRRLRK